MKQTTKIDRHGILFLILFSFAIIFLLALLGLLIRLILIVPFYLKVPCVWFSLILFLSVFFFLEKKLYSERYIPWKQKKQKREVQIIANKFVSMICTDPFSYIAPRKQSIISDYDFPDKKNAIVQEIFDRYSEFIFERFYEAPPIEEVCYKSVSALYFYRKRAKDIIKIPFRKITERDFAAITFLFYLNEKENICFVDFSNKPYLCNVSKTPFLTERDKTIYLLRRMTFETCVEQDLSINEYICVDFRLADPDERNKKTKSF